jgi:hypothetical protein
MDSNDSSIEAGNEAASLAKLRRQFMSYASIKDQEILEARQAWEYYHNKQWTKTELRELKRRKQPDIVFNRLKRKINGMVGVLRKLRTDPKAYPRTEAQEFGAEIATQTTRYILDASHFEDIETEVARDGGLAGIGVDEMELVQGDHGDPDIGFNYVDPRTFFYDPRSVKHDFSDARFMGTYKWCSIDEIEEMFPGFGEKVRGQANTSAVSSSYDQDRDQLWSDDRERVRLVDHWYIQSGVWWYCIYVGEIEIQRAQSPFYDEKNRSICKYFPFSYYIDDDGDRYGDFRIMKGPQDSINQHRSKAAWIMNARQIWMEEDVAGGADGDIEKLRREVRRPDGVLVFPTGSLSSGAVQIQTGDAEFVKQTEYFNQALQEIETYGPNLALIDESSRAASGRSLAIQQQAGMAELGPLLKNFRSWKLRQYRAAWCAAQRYWTTERWIRVTDDDRLKGFLPINTLAMDPQTLQTTIQNALGSIDVDILLDEGPDTETVTGDVNDMLMALTQAHVPVPPEMIIETSQLPSSKKDKLQAMLKDANQPDPAQEMAKKVALDGEMAKNQKVKADTAAATADIELTRAQTQKLEVDAAVAAQQGELLQAQVFNAVLAAIQQAVQSGTIASMAAIQPPPQPAPMAPPPGPGGMPGGPPPGPPQAGFQPAAMQQ